MELTIRIRKWVLYAASKNKDIRKRSIRVARNIAKLIKNGKWEKKLPAEQATILRATQRLQPALNMILGNIDEVDKKRMNTGALSNVRNGLNDVISVVEKLVALEEQVKTQLKSPK